MLQFGHGIETLHAGDGCLDGPVDAGQVERGQHPTDGAELPGSSLDRHGDELRPRLPPGRCLACQLIGVGALGERLVHGLVGHPGRGQAQVLVALEGVGQVGVELP